MIVGPGPNSGGVTRTTILARDFGRLRLDENDLARLSEIVQQAASAHGGSLDIRIISHDGVDVVDASSPDVFYGRELPDSVRSVSISFADATGLLQCKIELGDATDPVSGAVRPRFAGLRVEGRDAREVQGLFHSLARELESRGVRGAWIRDRTTPNGGSLGFVLVLFLTAVVAALLLDDLGLRWVLGINITQWDRLSNLSKTESDRSTGLVFLGAFLAVALVVFIVNAAFTAYPPVEFHGRMTDRTAAARGRLKGVGVVLAIPFVVDVVSALYVYLFLRGG